MEYIKVENNIVIAIVDTDDLEKLKLPVNNQGTEGKGKWLTKFSLPPDNEINIGDNIKDFDKDWKRNLVTEK